MTTYQKFRNRDLIRKWEELNKLDREEVVSLQAEWIGVDNFNREKYQQIVAEKHEKIQEVAKTLEAQGVPVYKYSKGYSPRNLGFQAWFKNNVADVISQKYLTYRDNVPTAPMDKQMVDGVWVETNQSSTNIVDLYDRIKHQVARGHEQLKKTDKLLIKSLEFAEKHALPIEGLTPREIIEVANDQAKVDYLERLVPEGTEIYLKHECYDCSTYIMGETRCSCGNRRIGIVVEGNLIEGYYHYPEAY